MPPKRQKSGQRDGGGSAGGVAGQQKWEAGLISAPFNDADWTCAVSMVVPARSDDDNNCNLLMKAVQSQARRLFHVVNLNDMLEMAKEVGNPKVKKEKNTPAFYEVNEAVKQYLDNGEPIPVQTLARLVKWHLLAVKASDLKRKEDEKKNSEKGGKPAGKAPGGKKGDRKGGSAAGKGKDKGKGKDNADIPPPPQKESKLKKRGEEDDDSKYIDDEPDDGPQCYVLLFGLTDALLVQALHEVGVAVDAVVRLGTDGYSGYHPPDNGESEADPDDLISAQSKAALAAQQQSEEKKIEREKREKILSKFWFELPIVLKQAPSKSKVQDCVPLEQIVAFDSIPADLESDEDEKHMFSMNLFEVTACLLYDMFDWKRQYLSYLENTSIQQVAAIAPPAPPPSTGADAITAGKAADKKASETPKPSEDIDGGQTARSGPGPNDLPPADMSYYNDLLSGVPTESMSVELLTHCLLEQVSQTLDGPAAVDGLDGSQPTARQDGLDASLAQHLSGVLMKLALSEEEKKAIEEKLAKQKPAEKSVSQTKLINFRDNLSLRLQSLKASHGFTPEEAERAMLHLTPSAALLNYPKPSDTEGQQIAARFQELLMHCSKGTLDQAQINHALKQFIFESIALKQVDDNGIVVDSAQADIVPWDDPYPFCRSSANEALPEERKEDEIGSKKSSEAGSRPSTAGILKSRDKAPGSAGSSRGRASGRASVSFNDDQLVTAAGDPLSPKPDAPQETAEERASESPSIIKDDNDEASDDKESEEGAEGAENDPLERSLSVMSKTKLRTLDDWCYVEHFQPDVLLQVLEEARYYLPFLEVYYCRKDNTLLLTLYNPVDSSCFNCTEWFSYLHTDVGFRNYLDYIKEKIADWTAAEEEKYQAELLEKERLAALTPSHDPEQEAGAATGAKGKRDRSASPKGRKGSRSKSPKGKKAAPAEEPELSEDEKDDASKPFMRPNSMKVWKLEQEKLKAEEEAKKKEQKDKDNKKGGGKASPKKGKGSPAGSRAGSRSGSAGSRGGSRSPSRSGEKKGKKGAKGGEKAESKKEEEAPPVEATPEPEIIKKPFHGYDLGNDIVHCRGKTLGLFPHKGAQVRVESTNFCEGSNQVRVTLLENGNILNLHIGEPKTQEDSDPLDGAEAVSGAVPETSETPDQDQPTGSVESVNKESEGQNVNPGIEVSNGENAEPENAGKRAVEQADNEYGSFSALLSDGINLSFSCFGETGVNPNVEQALKYIEMKPPTPPTPPAAEAKSSSAKGKKGGKGSAGKKEKKGETPPPPVAATPEPPKAGTAVSEEQPASDKPSEVEETHETPFQQLHVSAPNGLTVNYMLDKSSDPTGLDQGCLLVEQKYPFKSANAQDEAFKHSAAWSEKTRIVTSQGNVIRLLRNNKIEVLCADGTRMEYDGPWTDLSFVHPPPPQEETPRPASEQGSDRSGSRPGTASKKHAKSPTRKSPRAEAPPQEPDPAALEKPKELEPHERGIITWNYITGIGEQLITNAQGGREKTSDLKYYTASDPETMEVLMVREDRVMLVSRPDNTLIVDHGDGTRITTFYKEEVAPPPAEEENSDSAAPMEPSVQQVRFVKVECQGFATLVFNTDDSSCTTIFGSQTNLFAHPTGLYVSSCSDGSAIVISNKGQVAYVRKPDNAVIGYLCNCDSFDELPEEVQKAGIYVMKHNSRHIFQHTDSRGNFFNVSVTGETDVVMADDNDDAPEDVVSQSARYFVINPDQSGEELLRHEDIISYLAQAEEDPATAVIVDPLPEHPNLKGITVMQPCYNSAGEKWLLSKDETNIIPKNITSRDLKTLPPKEYKKPGPKFGTNVGKGLSVGGAKKSQAPVQENPSPVPKIPETVAQRQFLAYPQVDQEMRETLKNGVKSYCKSVSERNATLAKQRKSDPRSPEEIEKSRQLEMEANERFCGEKAQGDLNPFSSDVFLSKENSSVRETYMEAVKPPPPVPPPQAKPKRTNSAWGRDKAEIDLERENRRKLRNKEIPPYFQSYLAEKFVREMKEMEGQDWLEEAAKDLPYYENKKRVEKMRQEGLDVTNADATRPEAAEPPSSAESSTREKHEIEEQEKSSSSARNSPSEAMGTEGSPVRSPQPPATESNMQKAGESPAAESDYIRDPRQMYREPNEKFLKVEDPVRRKPKTISTAGAVEPVRIGAMRGFMVRPNRIIFGTLREGFTYGCNLQLKNIGLDSCRFKIKQPPPATGLTLNYKPGAVAAGMTSSVDVTLFAIASQPEETNQEAPDLLHSLTITTEAEIISLPVLAEVLPGDVYDARFGDTGVHGHSNMVQLISQEPTLNQDPVKPRPSKPTSAQNKNALMVPVEGT